MPAPLDSIIVMSNAHDSTGESAGSSPSGDGMPGYDAEGQGDEISFLDILLILARNKTIIVGTALVFAVMGATYSLLVPKEFTASAKVVPESKEPGGELSSQIPSGLAGGALSSLGIQMGGASAGLSPSAYPDVLASRTVRQAVVRDTFSFPDAERPMTFLAYMKRPSGTLDTILRYTIELPWVLKGALGRAINESPVSAGTTQTDAPQVPSEEMEDALERIGTMVSTSTSQGTGLMTITATATSPILATEIANSYLEHFTARVREIRTKKVRERLTFVEGRFQEVGKELEDAENRLAQFLERNQNPTTAQLRFQRQRLQREVRFKEQLYGRLQGQLTQTRLDLQRQQPVVTVMEEPVPPRQRSAPKRTFIVIVCFVVGGILGILGAFVKALFEGAGERGQERQKLREIRAQLLPRRWQREKEAST